MSEEKREEKLMNIGWLYTEYTLYILYMLVHTK